MYSMLLHILLLWPYIFWTSIIFCVNIRAFEVLLTPAHRNYQQSGDPDGLAATEWLIAKDT
jgi:hypothetical protein